MNRILIPILVLALAAGAYVLLSHDDTDTDAGVADRPEPPPPAPPTKGNREKEQPGLERAKGEVKVEPPQALVLKVPARLLLLADQPDAWTSLTLMVCASLHDLSYQSWFQERGEGLVGSAGRGLPELTGRPDAAWLEAQDVQALVLDRLDPNALPLAFWEAVAQRVRSGRMGLLVRPGFPTAKGGVGLTQHPALSHLVLQDLLPIAKAAPLRGTPTPGVFKQPQALVPTDAGRAHPASRLVVTPEASRQVWSEATAGDGALATQFCYPVESVKAGARTLLTCDAAIPLDALVTGPSGSLERVLWMGNADFGSAAYHVQRKDELLRILINHWIVWLVGQVAE